MAETPMSATPYEILGVAPTVTQEDLRRAYRRLLRETHPDTGGDSGRFVAVQRAWERIGTEEDRAAYDRGRGTREPEPQSWAAPSGSAPRQDTRPRARAYGHPGGWRRERYLRLMREWVGRGVPLDDPYEPALVRSAPRDIRHILADALAEEATAKALATLGIGFTVWHDVATGDPEEKVDHLVLGPSGLIALLSEDFGAPVKVRKGELIGEGVGDARPIHDLALRARKLRRSLRVRFTAVAILVPDDALEEPLIVLGSDRGAVTLVLRRSALLPFLRDGLPGSGQVGGTDLFDVRTALQAGIRFVE